MCRSDRDMPKLAEIADQNHAISAEKGYMADSSTTASTTATTPDAITMICEQIQKLQRQMNELSEKSRRPQDFSRRRL
jgi:ubiquinone biosynthesis protein UbiJ